MKIRTVIIDDEPIALDKLKKYIQKVPLLELSGEFVSAHDALAFIAENPVDAVFTDIDMPGLDGMSMVRSLTTAPIVVFITAYSEYAVESYSVSAADYLLKPYGFDDFLRAANRVVEIFMTRSLSHPWPESTASVSDSIFVKVDYRYVRISLSDITYIKGFGEYLQIYLQGKDAPLLTLSSFSTFRERLPENFLQVHRSFIVNLNRVDRVEKGRIFIDPDTVVPVGESYRQEFFDFLTRH